MKLQDAALVDNVCTYNNHHVISRDKENNYIVHEAKSAKEAIRIFNTEEGSFDLIFSDVVLPDMNGVQLYNKLTSKNRKLKVLFSSGYTNQKSQWDVIHNADYSFLQKPYKLHELLKAIKVAIKVNDKN